MPTFACFVLIAPLISAAQLQAAPIQPEAPLATNLLEIKRIYVEPLAGTAPAQTLRELIIAGLDSTKLFVLTDNPDRADAILKGAADDKAFTDSFDTDSSLSDRTDAGIYSGGKSSKSGGGYGAAAVSEREAHRIKERKHEAYAAVRLCNLAGDVIWSTTQESLGAKFRGASADVAAKIAKQLSLDVERARHQPATAARP
jgi:hypothetical protein